MQQTLQLNIIPFTPVASKGTFSFYGEKQRGFAPIYWGKIMETFPEGREAKFKNYYTDFHAPREGTITTEIKFADATIYDPRCGQGSLLLNVADEAEKINIYGQEKESATAGLALMNMVLHV